MIEMSKMLSFTWKLVKDMVGARGLRKELDEKTKQFDEKTKQLDEKTKELDEKTKQLDEKTKQLDDVRNQVRELEKGTESGYIGFAGMYLDENGLMPSVTNFLSSISTHDSGVFLALDFAAFGAISWNRQFCIQVESILGICKSSLANGSKVKLILNKETTNREVIERQFPEEEWDEWHNRSIGKIRDWLSCPIFARLAGRDVSARLNLSNVLHSGALRLTRQIFIDSFLEFNERLIELYNEEGAMTRRSQFVPLHGWFVRRGGVSAEGIIGIADARAVWNEPGFRMAGNVANKLVHFFEDMHGVSQQSLRRAPWPNKQNGGAEQIS